MLRAHSYTLSTYPFTCPFTCLFGIHLHLIILWFFPGLRWRLLQVIIPPVNGNCALGVCRECCCSFTSSLHGSSSWWLHLQVEASYCCACHAEYSIKTLCHHLGSRLLILCSVVKWRCLWFRFSDLISFLFICCRLWSVMLHFVPCLIWISSELQIFH